MKPKIAMLGSLIIISGCNQADNTRTDSSMPANTNEVQQAGKGPAPAMTNAAQNTTTNQSPSAPK